MRIKQRGLFIVISVNLLYYNPKYELVKIKGRLA